MASQLQVNDRCKVRVWCSDNEQASVNTYYYKVTAITGGGATDLDFASNFDNVVAPLYKALLTTGTIYNGVQVKRDNILPEPITQFSNLNAGPGTAGAPGLPRQAAGLISWQTALAGPAFRGRTYLPFPDATHNTNAGVPTMPYVGNAQALATALASFTTVVGAGTASVSFVIWSKKRLTLTPVTESFVADKWATVRKRGSYGRANVSPI
jgi:hypothetical protein